MNIQLNSSLKSTYLNSKSLRVPGKDGQHLSIIGSRDVSAHVVFICDVLYLQSS